MKRFKPAISIFLVFIITAMMLPVTGGVSAAAAEISVNWNTGYIGSSTHTSQAYNIVGSNTNYAYTDVITVAKAGTKISFTDSASSYASANVYVISSWTGSGSNWQIDKSYANYAGAAAAATTAVQSPASSGGVLYAYVTSRDNEHIRLCYQNAGSTNYPKVYSEYVGGTGTYEAGTAALKPDGTPLSVGWTENRYVGSEFDPDSRCTLGVRNGAVVSDVITVAKAGTKLSWVDPSGFLPINALTVSSWKKDSAGKWVFDSEGAAYRSAGGLYSSITETMNSNGSISYSYITSKDNENIRICYDRSGEESNPTIYTKTSAGTGSWSKTQSDIYDKSKAVARSAATGAVMKSVKVDISWNMGYIGSMTHASKAHTIVSNLGTYLYSDVITIANAGTTICFFDGDTVGYDNAQFASVNCAAFTSYKKSGNSWEYDPSGVCISCADADTVIVDGVKMYSYTTTKNNESLRLGYRASYTDPSGPMEIYDALAIMPVSFELSQTAGQVYDGGYTDENGSAISYKLFVPETCNDGAQHSLFVVTNGDSACYDMLRSADNDAFIAYCEESAADNLTDKLVKNYAIRRSDIFLVGSSALNDKYPDLFAGFAAGVASVDEAKALVSQASPYYNCLEGLTMYAMGDSYFDGAGIGRPMTWVSRLGAKYAMDYINYGIGGSTLSSFVTTRNPMTVRVEKMEKGKPDIIFLEGGRNDRTEKTPFGAVDGTDIKTYCGALNTIINYMLKTYPDALIICITPWNYNDSTGSSGGYAGTTASYAAKMLEVVKHIGNDRVKALNMADTELSGVDMNSSSFRAKYSLTDSDISHMNPTGHSLVLSNIEDDIAALYAEYRGVEISTPRNQKVIAGETIGEVPGSPDAEISSGADKNGNSGSGVMKTVLIIVAAVVLAALLIAGGIILLKKKNKQSSAAPATEEVSAQDATASDGEAPDATAGENKDKS